MMESMHTPFPWYLSGTSAHKVIHGDIVVADCSVDSIHPALEERAAANAKLVQGLPGIITAARGLLAETRLEESSNPKLDGAHFRLLRAVELAFGNDWKG